MKAFYSIAAATQLLVFSNASAAAPKAPKPTKPAKPAKPTTEPPPLPLPAAGETSPEESKRRKEWSKSMLRLPAPGGGMASFNAGASVVTRTEVFFGGTAPPICVAQPALIFTESTSGGATSSCAAASTIGDTHLATFNGLFYDFQASGDFILLEVDPGFTVQTRQVSGAPTWPDATVNHGVAARIGKTQVAICLGENDQPARLIVDGKPASVNDGVSLSLPEGVDVLRRGNVYLVTSESGDSVRAEVNPAWMNVSVGLGRWPAKARGLIAPIQMETSIKSKRATASS